MKEYYLIRYTAKYDLNHMCQSPYYQKTFPKRCNNLDEVKAFIQELKEGKFPAFHKGAWGNWTGVKLVSYEVFKVTEIKINIDNQDIDLTPVQAITKYNQDIQKIHVRNNKTGGCLCGVNPKQYRIIDLGDSNLFQYMNQLDLGNKICKRCKKKLNNIL